MSLIWSKWTNWHTLIAIACTITPLSTGLLAFANADKFSLGNWNSVEITWTTWGVVGITLNTIKVRLLTGDLRWARRTKRPWRYVVGCWWALVNGLALEAAFAAFIGIGVVSGQLPSIPVDVGARDVPASLVSGGLLIITESVMLGATVFSLMARVVLGHVRTSKRSMAPVGAALSEGKDGS